MKQMTAFFKNDQKTALSFDDLTATDKVVISTQNSQYRFSVIDPARRRGTLSGGSLGDQPRDAILVGTLGEETIEFDTDTWNLATEARAMFDLRANNGWERMITSPITDIALIRDEKRKHYIA
jgi:hypothetical protein